MVQRWWPRQTEITPMTPDLLGQIEFWHWLVAAVVLFVLEIFAPGFVLLWFAVAATVVGLALLALPDLAWQSQALTFCGGFYCYGCRVALVCQDVASKNRPSHPESPGLSIYRPALYARPRHRQWFGVAQGGRQPLEYSWRDRSIRRHGCNRDRGRGKCFDSRALSKLRELHLRHTLADDFYLAEEERDLDGCVFLAVRTMNRVCLD